MPEIKKINGKTIKDETARNSIAELQTQVDELRANGMPVQATVEPAELDMPKVFFYGDALPTTKDNVNLTMDYISNTDRFSSYIKLKCQGTSSMSYNKKNFTINMYSDEARETKLKKNFKGWGAQSKFCLKANWVDSTHTRNISGARIGYDMVASRPDSAFKQQLLTAPRYGLVDGFPIKVYFNGEFHGIYTWNIPKDGWMFNMDESNPNHVVLCAERNTDGNSTAINSCQFRKLWDGGGDWSYEFGTPSDTVKNSLNRCIGFVMNATDQEFHDNIGQYFDLYSLLDYYCFSYLVCHLDGLAKNMLMVTYDGVIWGASLYDMDSIYGVSWNGASFVATNYRCPEQYQEQFSRLWQRIEACFATELYARYLELRQGALSLSNIVKHVEEIYDVIPDRVFADEKIKWTNIPQVANNTMTRFRNYMRDRAVYVDAEMLALGTVVDCTGISLNKTELDLGVFADATQSENVIDVNLNENITSGREITNSEEKDTATTTKLLTGLIDVSDMDNYLYVLDVTGTTESDQRYAFYTSEESIATAISLNTSPERSCLNITRGDNTYPYIKVMTNSIDGNETIDTIQLFKFSKSYLASTLEDFTSDTITGTGDVYVPISVTSGDIVVMQGDANYWTGMSFVNTGIDVYMNTKSADYKAMFIPEGKDTLYFKLNPAMYTAGETLKYKIFKPNELLVPSAEKLSDTLIATLTPSNTTQDVVWSSSDNTKVKISASGVQATVTAVANGTATVTATCGTQSATCNVTVSGMSEGGGNVNLLADHSLTSDKFINGNTGVEGTTSKVYACLDYIEIQPNTKYSMSTTSSNSIVVSMVEYDENKNYISRLIADGTLPQEITTSGNAKYIRFHTTSISDMNLLSLTVSGMSEGGGGTPSGNTAWETSNWTEGYYNDTGTIRVEGSLKMYHSDLLPVNGDETITVEVSSTINESYTRISYFNKDESYLGFDRGSGWGVSSGNSNIITIDLSSYGRSDIAYIVINANSDVKDNVTVSGMSEGGGGA